MDIKHLDEKVNIPRFIDTVPNKDFLKTYENLDIMQVNVGKLCNLTCKHCHVLASPNSTEIMSKDVLVACLEVFKKHNFKIMDITGGAPEMNPNFEWFLQESSKIAQKVIVRTNLVILLYPNYKHLINVYAKNKVNVVCSLPFYTKNNTDIQRGDGVFDKSIEVLKMLNDVGYGKEKDLVLDIVYNPSGAFLPPPQSSIENLYKDRLYKNFSIVFNNLYTITNNPIGRFGDFLQNSGNLDTYLNTLYYAFNPDTVENMMCRNQISVSWDGYIYDCDFNQAVDIKVSGKTTIFDLLNNKMNVRNIVTGKHCFACTAGAGSSCGGATT